MEKARDVMDRDNYFINIANEIAIRSKDPSTQV
jgi:deoxycytidylate deaminase